MLGADHEARGAIGGGLGHLEAERLAHEPGVERAQKKHRVLQEEGVPGVAAGTGDD